MQDWYSGKFSTQIIPLFQRKLAQISFTLFFKGKNIWSAFCWGWKEVSSKTPYFFFFWGGGGTISLFLLNTKICFTNFFGQLSVFLKQKFKFNFTKNLLWENIKVLQICYLYFFFVCESKQKKKLGWFFIILDCVWLILGRPQYDYSNVVYFIVFRYFSFPKVFQKPNRFFIF